MACWCDNYRKKCDLCQVAFLEAENERLVSAIRWALGEEGEFPPDPARESGKWRQPYYWRTELRRRAALSGAPPDQEVAKRRKAMETKVCIVCATEWTGEDTPNYCPECGGWSLSIKLRRHEGGC